MGVDDLGALVLGGTRASALAAAGRIHGDASMVDRADLMFAAAVAPFCSTSF